MKIYITGLPSGYEVEHLVRLFYPMAPLTLTPPEEGEDCVWAEKKEDSLYAMVREQGQSRDAAAPLPRPVEAGGETVEFTLASLTYDLLRSWTGIRPPWGKMTGVRPVRLIHDKRAAGWTEAEIDRFFLDRFRKLDVRQLSHRRMLIDTFVNAVFLYDDKLVLTYNFREGTETITFDDLKNKLGEGFSGSDMSSVAAPKQGFQLLLESFNFFLVLQGKIDLKT